MLDSKKHVYRKYEVFQRWQLALIFINPVFQFSDQVFVECSFFCKNNKNPFHASQ